MKEEKSYTISLTSGSVIRGFLVVLLFLGLYYIKDIVLVVLAAVVVASSIEPATKWFGRKGIRRLPAVILVYAFLVASLVVLLVFFVPSLLNETVTYLNNLPQNINLNDLWSPISGTGFFGDTTAVNTLAHQSFSISEVISTLRGVISGTGEGAFRTVGVLFGGVLSLILIVVLSFYLAVQEDGVGNFLRIITPVKNHEYIIDLWKRSQLKIGYWMQGQLLLGVIIGVLVYLLLMIIGIQHALLLATIAALFELIPVFGPILSAVPAIIIAMGDKGVTMGIIVALAYLVIHQFENHLLYPLVVRKIVGVSPILVILALVIGFKLAGFLGAVLAVPMAAVLMEYVSDIEKHKSQKILA